MPFTRSRNLIPDNLTPLHPNEHFEEWALGGDQYVATEMPSKRMRESK
jgi:hypothetical protein